MARNGSEPPTLDLEQLPADLRRIVEAAMDGADIQLLRGGEEIGILVHRASVLEGVVLPDHTAAPQDAPLPQGVTVVATAMRLSDAARRRLSDEFGSDYVVLDLLEAPETTDVVLIHPVSPQLVGQLKMQFPQARMIVTEIEDEELGVHYGGSVSRLLDAGASAYLPPRPVAQVAATVHEYLAGAAVPALEAQQRPARARIGRSELRQG